MALQVGDEAPDFTLPTHDGEQVTLSELRGETGVALVFIPFAFTGVCQGELCELRDNVEDFEAKQVKLLAITCDRAPTLARWAEDQGFNFTLLSDGWPHGEVSRRYETFNEELGCAMRRTVVVDRDGKIVDLFDSAGLRSPREKDRYGEALTKV